MQSASNFHGLRKYLRRNIYIVIYKCHMTIKMTCCKITPLRRYCACLALLRLSLLKLET